MKFIDLFAGIGGFHYGLQKANDYKSFSKKWESEEGGNWDSEKSRTLLHDRSDTTFSCVWANEFNKYAGEIYQKRFPETEFSSADIRTVDADGIPDHDLLCGGFPCQAFSIAGKRKGFDDTRGTLFFEIARIIKAKKPKIVLLENVKGLLSHENGRTFGRIISVLGELGYWVEWQVLNSKNYGVPQNRERVFIVGHLRGESPKKIFPFTRSNQENNKMEQGKKVIDILKSDREISRVYDVDGLAPTLHLKTGGWQEPKIALSLDAHYYKGISPSHVRNRVDRNIIMIGELNQTTTKRAFDTPKEINEFLRANKGNFTNKEIADTVGLPLTQVEHYFRTDSSRAIPNKENWIKLKELLRFDDSFDKIVTETIEKANEFEMSQRVYSSEGIAKTLQSSKETGLYSIAEYRHPFPGAKPNEECSPALKSSLGSGNQIIINKIRRLIPTECERLQGFPDGWTEGLSDTQRYKTLGNAVTTNVVTEIGLKLIEVIKND